MKLYTIGFTQKNARTFFNLLRDNNVKTVVDIRLNNTSQLAAFAKGEDLKFFLTEFCQIEYVHDITFAPTETLLKDYKTRKFLGLNMRKSLVELWKAVILKTI